MNNNQSSQNKVTKLLNIDCVAKYDSQNKLNDYGIKRHHSIKTLQKSIKTIQVYKTDQQTSSKHNQFPKHVGNILVQKNQNNSIKISKSSSQPKMRTLKEQILRIPKVKQILQKDKLIFQQDIEKRLELIGDVKNQKYSTEEYLKLRQLNKPVIKKTRRHKTNYKIPLTRNNLHSLNNIIEHHISQNQHFKNEEMIFLSQKDYKQPFDLKKLQFMEEINPLKKMYKQKFPQFKEGVLKKNRLLLEHVILNRNIKREMKLNEKKRKKELEMMKSSAESNNEYKFNNNRNRNQMQELIQKAKTLEVRGKY